VETPMIIEIKRKMILNNFHFLKLFMISFKRLNCSLVIKN